VAESDHIFQPKGFRVDDKTKKVVLEYEKPEIKDYGDLRELTSASVPGPLSDVPKSHPAPFFS
jgi:hypothetical protein